MKFKVTDNTPTTVGGPPFVGDFAEAHGNRYLILVRANDTICNLDLDTGLVGWDIISRSGHKYTKIAPVPVDISLTLP